MPQPSEFRWSLRHRLAPACLACGVERGDPLCGGCLRDWFGAAPRCRVCANRLPARLVADGTPQGEAAPCGRCLARPPRFDATLVLGDYAAPLDGMVAALKFHARLDVGRALGLLLARRCAEEASRAGRGAAPGPTAVVPLPLAPRRLRERGFNQAEELARAAARGLELPLLGAALARVHDRPPQHGLDLARRGTNVRGVFAARGPLGHEHVLLVDDVLTTGSTLDEAAAALKTAGARIVTNLVAARTP
jgi:ComF family protein